MSRIRKKTSYRIWGWSSFFIFIASIFLLFKFEDIPYSLMTVAVVSFVSLFVWGICWGEKDWSEPEGKVKTTYHYHTSSNYKKDFDSSKTLVPDNSDAKEKASALETLVGLYLMDQIFGGDLFGKK